MGGEWSVKRISNPAYIGVWAAKKIANPEFVDDDSIYSYKDFSFIGFDLWQVKGGSLFDNIIITDDVAEADSFAAKWKALSEHEKTQKAADDAAKKLRMTRRQRAVTMTTMTRRMRRR